MSRGNGKQDIFLSKHDREYFLGLLESAVKECAWTCHSYCLMTNHYHLLIETPAGKLSNGMHLINSTYSRTFNNRYERIGHVLQGRYKSRLIKDDNDFLTVVRYTALNPVKAKLTTDPADWNWSSYNALAGNAAAPQFLDCSLVRSLFASPDEDGSSEYCMFILQGLQNALEGDLHHHPTLNELFREVADKATRKRLMSEAHYDLGYTMRDIAGFLGVSSSVVSRGIKDYMNERS